MLCETNNRPRSHVVMNLIIHHHLKKRCEMSVADSPRQCINHVSLYCDINFLKSCFVYHCLSKAYNSHESQVLLPWRSQSEATIKSRKLNENVNKNIASPLILIIHLNLTQNPKLHWFWLQTLSSVFSTLYLPPAVSGAHIKAQFNALNALQTFHIQRLLLVAFYQRIV